jgi:hypothetical protein
MRRLGFGEEQGALRRFGSLGRAKWAGVTRVARGWPGEREGEEGGRAGPRNGPREAGPAKTIGEAKPFFYFLPFYSFLYSWLNLNIVFESNIFNEFEWVHKHNNST